MKAPVAVLNLGGDCRICLYRPACDMRRSFDGLSALVRTELGADPTNGHWYVFVNRRRTMLKVLAFDAGGYWIWSKRLEQGRFAALSGRAHGAIALTQTGLLALLERTDFRVTRQRKRYRRAA